MALRLTANAAGNIYGGGESGWSFVPQTYSDQFNHTWSQDASGGWQRSTGWDDYGQTFAADDPYADKWGLQGSVGFDASPYQDYLRRIGQEVAPHLGVDVLEGDNPAATRSAGDQELLNDWYSNPVGIFDAGYNPTARHFVNPYGVTGVRDQIRDLAQRLGLTAAQADEIALSKAQNDLGASGQGRSEATAISNLADDLARAVFDKAGKGDSYKGLSAEQRQQNSDRAQEFQNRNKESDENAWKRDDFGGIYGLFSEHIQQAWEKNTEDGFLPSEQALAGADNPLNTFLQNQLRNKDWEPIADEYGLATKETSQKAQERGYDTGVAEMLNSIARQAAAMGTAGAANGFVGMGLESAGLSAAYAPAVVGATRGAYGASQAGGSGSDVLEGAVMGGVSSGAGALTDAAGFGEFAGAADAAAQGYQAYQNDNYLGLLGAGAGAANGLSGFPQSNAAAGGTTSGNNFSGEGAAGDDDPNSSMPWGDFQIPQSSGGNMADDFSWLYGMDENPNFYGSGGQAQGMGSGFDEYGNPIDSSGGNADQQAYVDINGNPVGNAAWYQSALASLGGLGSGAASTLSSLFGGGKGGSTGGIPNALIGALLGGAMGGMGGSKPAGTTTSVQDIPEWQKNLIMGPLYQGRDLLTKQQGQTSPLLAPAEAQMGKTIAGDYLDPNTNPYLRQYGQVIAEDTMRPIASAFEGAGRYGSPAFAGTAAKSISDNLSKFYGSAYQLERGNQVNATGAAPAFESASLATPWSPYQNFMNIAGGNFGGSKTDPYFQNKLGNVLGGAAVGKSLFT